MTRVATPDNEEQLLTVALGGTASQVETIVRCWRKADRVEAAGQAIYKERKKDSAEGCDPEITFSQKRADALRLVAASALQGGLDPGNGADRYQVVVHVDQSVLPDANQPGQSVLDIGVGVSAETSQRIACDASVVEMKHDAEAPPAPTLPRGPIAALRFEYERLGLTILCENGKPMWGYRPIETAWAVDILRENARAGARRLALISPQ